MGALRPPIILVEAVEVWSGPVGSVPVWSGEVWRGGRGLVRWGVVSSGLVRRSRMVGLGEARSGEVWRGGSGPVWRGMAWLGG